MNNYSQELQDWTRKNFASIGYTFMKSVSHKFYTIGYDRSLYIDDEAERLIPDTEKSKDIVLFKYERKSKDWLSGKSIPVEGIEYYKSFNDIDEMLDDDWVAD